MKEFSKLKKQIPFHEFESPNLDLYSHYQNYLKKYNDLYISCGSAAVGLLLNKNPKLLDKQVKNPKQGWFTTNVIQYLKQQGYTVRVLSKHDVLNVIDYTQFPLTKDHVLLINGRVNQKENSMFIVHQNKIWHNYDYHDISPLFFLNKPTQDVLLVHHKKWSHTKPITKKYMIFTNAC